MSFPYQSQDEIDDVIRGFESCTTAKNDFPHQSHLTVAISYLYESSLQQGIENMRAGLFRFLEHHRIGKKKYNETVTIFWMKMVEREIKRQDPNLSQLAMTNAVISSLGNSRLVFEFYSAGLLNSQEAKEQWTDPDLQSM